MDALAGALASSETKARPKRSASPEPENGLEPKGNPETEARPEFELEPERGHEPLPPIRYVIPPERIIVIESDSEDEVQIVSEALVPVKQDDPVASTSSGPPTSVTSKRSGSFRSSNFSKRSRRDLTEEEKIAEKKRQREAYKAATDAARKVLNEPEFSTPFREKRKPYEFELTGEKYDKEWRQIYHKDKTAHAYAEYFISERQPIMMPTISLEAARHILRHLYFVSKNPTQTLRQYKSGQKPSQDIVQKFVREVTSYHFLSFDTEGNGKLKKRNGHKSRLCTVFSSPVSGDVLLFHDTADISQPIHRLLKNYSIAKIQSGIATDIKLMSAAGIDIRGVVDSQVLFLFVAQDRPDNKCGAAAQLEEIYPGTGCVVDYDYRSMKPDFDNESLRLSTQRHVIQDVLTPYATLFQAAILQAETLGYQETRDIFPLMNECLEIAYSKSPKDVRKCINPDRASYWYPKSDATEFNLNSLAEVTRIRRARGDFIEKYPDGYTRDELAEKAKAIWAHRQLPSPAGRHFRGQGCLQYLIATWCQNCGDRFHKLTECPTPFKACTIKHLGTTRYPMHSKLMCPQVHSHCKFCRIRGHMSFVHDQGVTRSPRQLRAEFLKYAADGLLTSIPFLHTDDHPLDNGYWKMAIGTNTLVRGQADLWLYKGPGTYVPQELEEKLQDHQALADKNLNSTESTYEPTPDYHFRNNCREEW